ncbi:MAG: leucyl aminopeptidase family protein [Desulfurococcales archaeon]|nr:leucyl aminopeptidase family protein [Desulfurococcales archaeon]
MVLYTKPPTVEKVEKALEHRGWIIAAVPQKGGKPFIAGVLKSLDEKLGLGLDSLVSSGRFAGKKGELLEIPRGETNVILVGLGEDPDAETVRRAYAKAIKKVVNSAEEVLILVSQLDEGLRMDALVGALLGAYALEAFKTEKKRKLSKIFIDSSANEREALAIAEGVYLARDVANAPPNHVYPEALAAKVESVFKGLGVSVEVKRYDDLVKEGFGGIVNVGKGSARKPLLIILKYGKKEKPSLALVGKTVVFDAGGINLKPSHSLFAMRHDKAGGAAVLGAVYTIAKMGLPIDLVALIPAAINVPSGESYLPSDVIRLWDGTWVEVGNTDAEGRLTLADAIAYAAKHFDADTIITMATLTGSIVAALGSLIAGLFTSDDSLKEKMLEASRRSGDKLWPMPLEDDYRSLLAKSAKLGDVNNVAVRWGDAIYAALFLERFSHGKKFVHIDMAGPGIGADPPVTPPDYWPRGAPGYGARLIYELAKILSSKN